MTDILLTHNFLIALVLPNSSLLKNVTSRADKAEEVAEEVRLIGPW